MFISMTRIEDVNFTRPVPVESARRGIVNEVKVAKTEMNFAGGTWQLLLPGL